VRIVGIKNPLTPFLTPSPVFSFPLAQEQKSAALPVAPSLVFLFLFSSPFSSSRVRIWRWNFESLYHRFMGKEALPS